MTAAALLLCGCAESRVPPPAGLERPPAIRGGDSPIVFRLADPMPMDHPYARTSAYFAELVRKESGGRINIKVYYNGKLGAQEQVLEQMRFGGIAMGRISILELAQKIQSLEYDLKALMPQDPDSVMKWLEENRARLQFDCQTEKLYPLAFLRPDLRCIYSDSPVLNYQPAFSGMRIGTLSSRIMAGAIRQLGAVPVDIISADTYSSMRSGYMRARETAFSDFVFSADYPFITHVILANFISSPDLIIMSSEILADISAADRNLLVSCAARLTEYHERLMDGFTRAQLAQVGHEKKLYNMTGGYLNRLAQAMRQD
ncbi:MAG: TRAP transporter substrate-binding protein DctP [Spirochaetales bacterium]|jgi:TRAP-type C4-dicarboxylate transport system substrate-binding protein|nr:TRAP transporter substrate-binding protein DctP [Spirochaetales bacterium]